jgi:hypothetical protein
MRPRSEIRYRYGRQPRTFSAWTMSIVFIAVAMISFAIDQTVVLSLITEEQGGRNLPSLLHPVQLIESLIDATSE